MLRSITRATLLFAPLLLPLSPPATALDFDVADIVYHEAYSLETAYPLVPEVDLAGAGGMDGFSGPLGGFPPLVQANRLLIVVPAPNADFVKGVSAALPDIFGDIGARAEFSGAAAGGSTNGGWGVLLGVEGGGYVTAGVGLTTSVGGNTGELVLEYKESAATSPILVTQALTAPVVASIVAGATTTVDLFLDRDRALATATVDVGAHGEQGPVSTNISAIAGLGVTGVNQNGAASTGSLFLDLDDLKLYDRLEWGVNLDVSIVVGLPADTYSAAGIDGTWNPVLSGANALVDTEGVPVGTATLTVDSDADAGGSPIGPVDELYLIHDYATVDVFPGFPGTWTLDLSGLPEQHYRVIVYAPPGGTAVPVSSGAMLVNGIPLPDLPGMSTAGLVKGITHDSAIVFAGGGSIAISGTKSGGSTTAGLSGVQLIALEPAAVSAAGPLARLVLGAAFLALAPWVRRRGARTARRG